MTEKEKFRLFTNASMLSLPPDSKIKSKLRYYNSMLLKKHSRQIDVQFVNFHWFPTYDLCPQESNLSGAA